MQVNKANFPVVFPHFKKLLKTCSFYAFDEEMTGISVPEVNQNATQTPEESYQSRREAASRYGIIQVGISLFHRDEESSNQGKYIARPFNFLLFPSRTDVMQEALKGNCRDFALNPSSIGFLRQNHMNFQSWVYEGMAYCTEAEKCQLQEWWTQEERKKEHSPPPSPSDNPINIKKTRENERIRQLLESRSLMDMFGFRLVFEELVDCKKVCVGHNCFADILFLLASLDKQLPNSLSECKERIHKLFPKIYDTKYISTRSFLCPKEKLLQFNCLGGLYQEYGLRSDHVEIELPLGFQSYDPVTLAAGKKYPGLASQHSHEAGYDALMTGAVFANMMHLASQSGNSIEPCENKIALFGSLYALQITDTAEEYLPAGFSVFSLMNEKGVNCRQLDKSFADITTESKPILYRITNESALLVIPPSLAETTVLETLKTQSPGINILPYEP